MWRKDRFEADVKRVGRSKVSADLFGDKTDINLQLLQKGNEALNFLRYRKNLRIAGLQRNLDMAIYLAKAGQSSDT